jgi:serine/threonine protein kinase
MAEGGYNRHRIFMPLAIGTQLGSHEITALLGKGGMGEVYRARDTKLKREVAIKILPSEFSRDGDRVSRFQREAELLASLNHPHIAGIYDIAEADGLRYLVLELVEGETLEDRLKRGRFPVDEALSIAQQIAEALEAAHEKGIVHRDLKPANVKITPDGKIKVLDFGLAKAFSEQESVALSNSPTMMSASVPGMILGTAAYMSPEQARGLAADNRSDVFSFGCVLYEMLAGRNAFPGETLADIFVSIMKAEPDWSLLDPNTPAAIQLLLRRCLQKERGRRMRNIGDAAIEIHQVLTEPLPDSAGAEGKTPSPSARLYVLGFSILAVVISIAVFIGLRRTPAAPEAMTIRFAVEPPDRFFTRGSVPPFVVSPDGRHLAFLGEGATRKLWLRSLDSSEIRPIPGTESARLLPFWSPDSKYLGFFSNNNLQKVSIADGHSQVICSVPAFTVSTWNSSNVIVTAVEGTLYRVSGDGGDLQVLLAPPGSRDEVYFDLPEFLPDDDHFLYSINSPDREARGLWVRSLKSGEQKRLLPFPARARYLSGYLLYLRDDKVIAHPFDLAKLLVTGEPIGLTLDPGRNESVGAFHISSNGVLAWSERPKGAAELVWRDRTGKKTAVGLAAGLYSQVRLSPDASRAALLTSDSPNIWLLEMSSGVFSQLNSSQRSESDMVWSPDGRELAFASRGNLFRRAIGSADAVPFFQSGDNKWLHDWSPDGRYLIFAHGTGAYAVSTTGEQKPITLVENGFAKDEFRVSPDNRWIAYNSDESSGRSEVYVASFPKFDRRRQVSNSGGAIPRWRGDMKELYYMRPDGMLMAVDIRPGEVLETSAPHALFQADVPFTTVVDQYDVTADGKKFLVIENEQNATSPPINIVVNWVEELRKRR